MGEFFRVLIVEHDGVPQVLAGKPTDLIMTCVTWVFSAISKAHGLGRIISTTPG